MHFLLNMRKWKKLQSEWADSVGDLFGGKVCIFFKVFYLLFLLGCLHALWILGIFVKIFLDDGLSFDWDIIYRKKDGLIYIHIHRMLHIDLRNCRVYIYRFYNLTMTTCINSYECFFFYLFSASDCSYTNGDISADKSDAGVFSPSSDSPFQADFTTFTDNHNFKWVYSHICSWQKCHKSTVKSR